MKTWEVRQALGSTKWSWKVYLPSTVRLSLCISPPPLLSSSPSPTPFPQSFSVFPPAFVDSLALPPLASLSPAVLPGAGLRVHLAFVPPSIPQGLCLIYALTNACLYKKGPSWPCFHKPVCSQGPWSHQPQPERQEKEGRSFLGSLSLLQKSSRLKI